MEQTMNLTLGNMTLGPNDVMDIKNQLVMLQEQLVNFDFEDYERTKVDNNMLKQNLSELESKLVNLETKVESVTKEKESTVEELTAKHKLQIQIITTKMREEMNLNLPALEDKVSGRPNFLIILFSSLV